MKMRGIVKSIIAMLIGGCCIASNTFGEELRVEFLLDPDIRTIDLAAPQPVTIIARPSNDDVTFRWNLDGVGSLNGNAGDAGHIYLPPQDMQGDSAQAFISVVVTDTQGQTAKASVTFTLTQPPTAAPSLPKEWKDPVTGMEFVLIPAGEFLMGTNCPNDDPFTDANEFENCKWKEQHPAHRVVIKEPFYMGKYEVTQEEWYNVMGNNPSHFKSEKAGMDSRRHPVENISWNGAQDFLKRLNARSSNVVFRLPSEAEWEYAARAGTQTAYSFGEDPKQLGAYAWYLGGSYGNSNDMTHPVGQKQPNAFGLYDMYGNVWEWCQDWFDETYYVTSPRENPQGPLSGAERLLRGGSWVFEPFGYCSACRQEAKPDHHSNACGFRVVAVLARMP